MRFNLLLSLSILLSTNVLAEVVSLECGSTLCKIPFDSEGYKNGKEVCYKDESYKEIVKEVSWERGIRQGTARCYRDGKLKIEAEYSGDELNGIFVQKGYDSRGSRVRLLKNSRPDGYEFSLNDSGEVVSLNWCWREGEADTPTLTYCHADVFGKYTNALKTFLKNQQEKNKKDAEILAKNMNGPQITKYSSGKTKSTYTNVDGKVSGTYKRFYETGKLQFECEYLKDRRNGFCSEYDEDGRLDQKEKYESDKLIMSEKYFDNGKMSEKVVREDGKEKFCTTYYYQSGSEREYYCRLTTSHWRNDFDGPYKYWSNDHVLVTKGQYENGKQVGEWETFYSDGRVASKSQYEKGILTKELLFLDYRIDGDVSTSYKHRIQREYFPDGSVKKETQYPGHDGPLKEKVI